MDYIRNHCRIEIVSLKQIIFINFLLPQHHSQESYECQSHLIEWQNVYHSRNKKFCSIIGNLEMCGKYKTAAAWIGNGTSNPINKLALMTDFRPVVQCMMRTSKDLGGLAQQWVPPLPILCWNSLHYQKLADGTWTQSLRCQKVSQYPNRSMDKTRR